MLNHPVFLGGKKTLVCDVYVLNTLLNWLADTLLGIFGSRGVRKLFCL